MSSVLSFGALDLGEAPSQLFPEAIGGDLAIGMRGSFGGFEAILVTVKVRRGCGSGLVRYSAFLVSSISHKVPTDSMASIFI